MREGRGVALEAALLAVDAGVQVDLGHAADVAAEAQLLVLRNELDAGTQVAQRVGDAGAVIAEAGNDAQAGDDDAFHGEALRGSRWR
ncbi:hypothetical protein D3C83_123480 [compost metagenome]